MAHGLTKCVGASKRLTLAHTSSYYHTSSEIAQAFTKMCNLISAVADPELLEGGLQEVINACGARENFGSRPFFTHETPTFVQRASKLSSSNQRLLNLRVQEHCRNT